jgi:archaellin
MEIVFSIPGIAPVTLTRGTRDSTSIFTTTVGGNAVTELLPDEEVDIYFRVKPVSGGTNVNIEVRPPDRAALIISRTVPAVISSLNVL